MSGKRRKGAAAPKDDARPVVEAAVGPPMDDAAPELDIVEGDDAAPAAAPSDASPPPAAIAQPPPRQDPLEMPLPAGTKLSVDPHTWIKHIPFGDTGEIPLPQLLIDEVIGQEEAVAVAKKAARQRRHLLLLGDPGTGKSMIAKAMAQILPASRLDDVVIHGNPKDANRPATQIFAGGEGRKTVQELQHKARKRDRWFTGGEWGMTLALFFAGLYAFWISQTVGISALIAGGLFIMIAIFFFFVARTLRPKLAMRIPNLLIERPAEEVPAPYIDATGSHAGALLGDVRHDPFQSGGLETPTHLRVEPGAIHRAHKGLLFIDEINVLRLESQQALLTAMQDKKYAITGQSDRSSGAMVRTDPVPCDFILVAAGNMDVIAPTDTRVQGLHPALRSRIRGYGYEVYVKSVMDDTDANRRKLVRFVAQEVRRDGQIPHLTAGAVAEIVREAQRRSGHTGKLTLRLRELGGLVRTAGDLARDENAPVVSVEHVLDAKRMSMSLEYQVTRRGIEVTTVREALETRGEKVGTATGATFLGTGETGEPAGIVTPVEADATIASDRHKGGLFVGGGLHQDSTLRDNVYAMLKRLRGADMAGLDIHVQALLREEHADLQSLGAAVATACISALESLPIKQDVLLVGALAVSGRLRSVDGITQMIEAGADLGYKTAIVPEANRDDVLLEHGYKERIRLVFAETLADALPHILVGPETRVATVVHALARKATA